ncbi:MAG: GumC family protein [Alphaproteobacteria bacterium]
MEFYRAWRILMAYKWLLILLPMIATAAGLAISYVLPEQYESTALVLVRPIKEIEFNNSGGKGNDSLDFPVHLSAPIDAPSKTYMEIIKSRAVAARIIDDLDLDKEEPKVYASWFEQIKDETKTWVKDALRTFRNYVLYGRDIPASPFQLAIENIEKNLKVTARKDTYVFEISYRSTNAEQAAAIANKAAEIFLEQNSSAHRAEAMRSREFIERQLNKSRDALEQARTAILAYKTSGRTFDLKSEYAEKLKNVADLENTLAKAEGRLAGLKPTSFKDSPKINSQQAEITALKQQIVAARAELTRYPQKEIQMNEIVLAEKLAEENYSFFAKQFEEARVREARAIDEIRVVSQAVPGLYPVKPQKYLYAGLSFATALVAAVALALFIEGLDPRVRSIDDLDDELGVPVLGAIPDLKRFSGR